MTKLFFATSNQGKQSVIANTAKHVDVNLEIIFPDQKNTIDVEETGVTFEENALLKAKAYQSRIGDNSMIFVGDDSGIMIPALHNKPGVYSKRWAGYEMTDEEIPEYCLEQMKGLSGDDRKAVFETVMVALQGANEPKFYRGQMWGRILEKPLEDVEPRKGLPFRSIFWIDELDRSVSDIDDLSPKDRGDFLTHREKALTQLLSDLSKQN